MVSNFERILVEIRKEALRYRTQLRSGRPIPLCTSSWSIVELEDKHRVKAEWLGINQQSEGDDRGRHARAAGTTGGCN